MMMKNKLYWLCKWFGHKFVGYSQTLEGDKSITQKIATEWCIKCGLSKKELGLLPLFVSNPNNK